MKFKLILILIGLALGTLWWCARADTGIKLYDGIMLEDSKRGLLFMYEKGKFIKFPSSK
jgi:hypothetical protein